MNEPGQQIPVGAPPAGGRLRPSRRSPVAAGTPTRSFLQSWRFWLLLAPLLAVAVQIVVNREWKLRSQAEAITRALAEATASLGAPAPKVLVSVPATRRSLAIAEPHNPFALPETLQSRPTADAGVSAPIDTPVEFTPSLPNHRTESVRDEPAPTIDAPTVVPPPNPIIPHDVAPAPLPKKAARTDAKPRGVFETVPPPPSRPVPSAPITRAIPPRTQRQVTVEIHVLQLALSSHTWHGVNLSAIPAATSGSLSKPGSQHQIQFAADQLAPVLQTLHSWGARPLISQHTTVDSRQQAIVTADGATANQAPSVALPHGSFSLLVTPTVTDEDRIQLRLQPAIHDSTIRVLAGRSDDTIAVLDATVLLADGEAILLGGLIHQRDVQIWSPPAKFGGFWPTVPQPAQRFVVPGRTETLVVVVPRVVSTP